VQHTRGVLLVGLGLAIVLLSLHNTSLFSRTFFQAQVFLDPTFRISLSNLSHFCISLAVLYNLLTSGIFGGSFSGESQWERHQQGDEIVYIVNGATTLTLIASDDADPRSIALFARLSAWR
jgi:hypothetical protein